MIFLTGPPYIWQSPRSHVNWAEISSARDYKGILYLESLGGYQLKEAPCRMRGGQIGVTVAQRGGLARPEVAALLTLEKRRSALAHCSSHGRYCQTWKKTNFNKSKD